MTEVFETNFAGISAYETDVSQEPITTTVLDYLTPSTGAAFYIVGVGPEIVAPTINGMVPVVPPAQDVKIVLQNLTSIPQFVGKFYPTQPTAISIPIIPSGNYTLTLVTKPKQTIQTYYLDVYSVPIAVAFTDTTFGPPPVGQLIKRTSPVSISKSSYSVNTLTYTTISLPEFYGEEVVPCFVLYAYGSGDFEMIIGNAVNARQVSYVNTPFPLEIELIYN